MGIPILLRHAVANTFPLVYAGSTEMNRSALDVERRWYVDQCDAELPMFIVRTDLPVVVCF